MVATSFQRFCAFLRKGAIEATRDTMMLRIIVAIPLIPLSLFGCAINADPRLDSATVADAGRVHRQQHAPGVTFSTLASNQMQANQLAQFTLMPSLLLSGFMFPFRRMPEWTQWIGQPLPTTHAIRIVRSLLLKGVSWHEIAPELWPISAVRGPRRAVRRPGLSRDARLRRGCAMGRT